MGSAASDEAGNAVARASEAPPDRRELAILAMPGAFGWWLVGRTNAAVAATGRKPRIHTVGMYDETFGPAPAEGEVVIYLAHAPSRAFTDRLAARNIPTVIALTPAEVAVAELTAAGVSDRLEPLRQVSASLAILHRVRHLGLASLTDVADASGTAAVIGAVASGFGLPLEAYQAGMPAGSSDQVPIDAAILRDGGPDRAALLARAGLEEDILAHVSAALDPMLVSLRPGGKRYEISWPFGLFLSGDAIGSPAPIVSDITGSARVLYYGPYLHVPDGKWLMRTIVGFSEGIEDMSFMLELLRAHNVIASGWIEPQRKGLFKVEMEVDLQVAEHPLEARLHSRTGAIGGLIGLAMVSFVPV